MKTGANLGGVRSINDILLRCYVNEDNCWIWKHGVNGEGYAHVWLPDGVFGSSRVVNVSRAAIALSGRKLLRSNVVWNICESKNCVNPAHLKVGSRSEMMAYKRDHGRLNINAASANHLVEHSAKLRTSKDIVAKIEQAKERGLNQRQATEEIGVGRNVVSKVYRGVHANCARHEGLKRNASVFNWVP